MVKKTTFETFFVSQSAKFKQGGVINVLFSNDPLSIWHHYPEKTTEDSKIMLKASVLVNVTYTFNALLAD